MRASTIFLALLTFWIVILVLLGFKLHSMYISGHQQHKNNNGKKHFASSVSTKSNSSKGGVETSIGNKNGEEDYGWEEIQLEPIQFGPIDFRSIAPIVDDLDLIENELYIENDIYRGPESKSIAFYQNLTRLFWSSINNDVVEKTNMNDDDENSNGRRWDIVDQIVFSSYSGSYQSESCPMILSPQYEQSNWRYVSTNWSKCHEVNPKFAEIDRESGTLIIQTKGPFSVISLNDPATNIGDSTQKVTGPTNISYDDLQQFYWPHTSNISQLVSNGFPFRTEFWEVRLGSVSQLVSNILPRPEHTMKPAPLNAKEKPHVLLLVIDSLPKPYFEQILPKTTRWLRNHHENHDLASFSFARYNSQPGSTAPNMVPIMTGKYYDGVKEKDRVKLKQFKWKTFPQIPIYESDWLQSQYHDEGYVTIFAAHDTVGCQTFPNQIDPKSNFDFVLPRQFTSGTCMSTASYSIGTAKPYCPHGKLSLQHSTDFYFNARSHHQDRPSFAWMHILDGHDGGQKTVAQNQMKLNALDLEFSRFFTQLERLNDTVVIFISDHGALHLHNRPFLHVLTPRWVLDSSEGLEQHLYEMQMKLISGFDIHQTLRHLAVWPQHDRLSTLFSNNSNIQQRPSISMFDVRNNIFENRTAEEARIPLEHSFCEPWVVPWMVKKQYTDFNWLVDFSMRAINSDSAIRSGACPTFHLKEINNVGWKSVAGVAGLTVFQVELTCVEGNPNKYHLYLHSHTDDNINKMDPPVDVQPIYNLTATTINMKEFYRFKYYNLTAKAIQSTILSIVRLKQITRYQAFEQCTPEGASPEFCVCESDVDGDNAKMERENEKKNEEEQEEEEKEQEEEEEEEDEVVDE